MNSLKGHLLVATPLLIAPIFTRSVLLMLEHTQDGAMGVILNHPTDATITNIAEKIFEQPFEWEKPNSLGGPVPGPLMAVHTVEVLADQQILPGVFSSIDASKLQAIIREKADPCLIIANYAGWGPGQLEGEIDSGSWFSLSATTEHIFWADEHDLWDVVRKELNAAQLSKILGIREVPEDPNLN